MAAEQFSPEWWMQQLGPRLVKRWQTIGRFEDYYEGRQPLAFATSKYREEFSNMLRTLSDNWMAMVVDAVEERLHVEGFRVGTDSTEGDKAIWKIWQRNELDADSEMAHSTALTTSVCPVIVWPGQGGLAEITVEHPSQVIVAYESGSRRKRAAALKLWRDEWDGTAWAVVYLPNELVTFKGPKGKSAGEAMQFTRGWAEAETDWSVNPYGTVPVVELANRPRLMGGGRSEIEGALSTQDQINKLVCDLMVASEFASFRQRWATGVEIPKGEDGKPLDGEFKAAIDRLWETSAPDAKFGEFTETSLGNIVAAIDNRVTSLAARTRTPPHYLLGRMVNMSGDGMKAAETGLVAKAKSRMRHFGERHEEIVRLAARIEGLPQAKADEMETIWRDPESRSESEHVDSLVKKLALKVPLVQLWEDAGYTPQQIARFRVELVAQAALDALLTPAPPPASGAAGPPGPPEPGAPPAPAPAAPAAAA